MLLTFPNEINPSHTWCLQGWTFLWYLNWNWTTESMHFSISFYTHCRPIFRLQSSRREDRNESIIWADWCSELMRQGSKGLPWFGLSGWTKPFLCLRCMCGFMSMSLKCRNQSHKLPRRLATSFRSQGRRQREQASRGWHRHTDRLITAECGCNQGEWGNTG